ncbi:molybdopterin-binding oxidoreductase [Kiloniella spongiae]|uniref:Molybdopterin-binding oxidoreductase n=1 Tax=Kiloniella spongiae TaxID=1489064 RepID=A0A0H2MS62_9PROT|nr:molybdopterin-dependent oxidoreductase [Kiloniella spongiae]KLN59485.1 molybdopterin-binding oxidoreductase [Kiloniella spongiae]
MSPDTAATTPNLQTKPSVCPLDCPDTCSLSVVTDGKHIIQVRGSDANPYTAGAICKKVSNYYPDFIHGEGRLTQPLLRTGPRGSLEYKAISWEEAFDHIYNGINSAIGKYGPQSVLPLNYSGPHGQLAGGSMDYRFFHKLGATQLDRGPLCGAVRGTAYTSLFGSAPGMEPEQAGKSDLIVVASNNVTVSNLHLARIIKAAKKNGAKLIVIDPKKIKIAEQADLYIQIKPGTDIVLFLALAAELEKCSALDTDFINRWVYGIEEYLQAAKKYSLDDAARICEVPLEQIQEFLSTYTAANNVSMSVGNGAERGHSGGSSIRAAMALQVITGNMGRAGAGVIAKQGFAFPATPNKLRRPDLMPEGVRMLNIVDVAKHILDDNLAPPIKAVFIYNHNPVCTHPDQNRMRRALSREDVFIVGCDVVMNDSMTYADIILPASSHFESPDIYAAYGQAHLQRAEPVIPAVGNSLPNTEIFRRLAARFGFNDDLFKTDDYQLMDEAYDPKAPQMKGLRPSEVPLDRSLPMLAENDQELIMCKTVFPATKTGKIELYSEDMEQQFGYGLPRYEEVTQNLPFALISPSSSKRTNATFGGHKDSIAIEQLEIHPQDAQAKGITNNSKVRIWNALGEVILLAKVTDKVKPGVFYSPKGTWLKSSDSKQTVNALINSEIRTDIMSGACYNDTFVDIAPA